MGSIPGSGRSLEKEMATHSTVLAWSIPWTEEPGRLQSMLQRAGHTERVNNNNDDKSCLFFFLRAGCQTFTNTPLNVYKLQSEEKGLLCLGTFGEATK